ncbi:MAG TPA: tetratricopeptide repeat protein [Candidatus Binataceae bacterium]|nr:tetratricopeptide repeat protein [Candidatus Binataceae bacterium]
MRRNAAALASGGCALMIVAGCHHDSVSGYLDQGDAAMQATKLSEAEAAYSEAEKLAPGDPRAHIALGNLYVFEHKPDLARAEFMKVLTIDPKNAATHAALGNLYLEQNQYALAENQFRAAVALEADGAVYRLDLAGALRREGKLAGAEDNLRTAIGLKPDDAKSHLALAQLLSSEPSRASEARAEYDEVRVLDPKLLAAPAGASATPSAAPSASAASAPPAAPKLKALNKLFLLTKDSPVYQNPDRASPIVAQVRRKKYVHVTGIAGDFLEIRLRNGTIGFIPTEAAE